MRKRNRNYPKNGKRRVGPLNGPACDESALIVRVANPATIRRAAASFAQGESSQVAALDRLREYVSRTPGAALTPLFSSGERFTDTPAGIEKARWELAVAPATDEAEAAPAALHLRLGSAADLPELQALLQGDGEISVHQPAIFYPPAEPRPSSGVLTDHQWALEKCGFRQVWDDLDQGGNEAPLAVIDSGRHTGHADLEGCIIRHEPPLETPQSLSVHASSVAGVLAAIRGNDDEEGMAGCCSAKMHLFNVWNGTFDYKAFCRSLEDVLASETRVVNLSLTSLASDPTVDELIQKCVAKDKVLVAAMGDFARAGNPVVFPAANAGVVAVGGTTRHDRRFTISSFGDHIWISAPAKDILTIFGDEDYEPLSGTSYSTAMVSAAVWLALRNRPELTLAQVRDLLSRSVAPRRAGPNTTFRDIGHGRLDMVKLKEALPAV
jgi:Subtilase family